MPASRVLSSCLSVYLSNSCSAETPHADHTCRCALRSALERGERIAVLGPSGAGKSTLLNLIAGFLPPASGSLLIDGERHNATPPAQRPVSMLFQENNLFNHLTVRQNIGLGIHPGLKLNREQRGAGHGDSRTDGNGYAAGSPAWRAIRRPAAARRRWPAVWCANSRCCCLMNPSRRLIRHCARRC